MVRTKNSINPPNKPQNKGGRPKKEINYKVLDGLCKIQCTGAECSSILNISYEVLDVKLLEEQGMGFQDYWAIKSAGGRQSLRRKQFQLALKGDKTMLVWLGKQYLGQAEKHELSGAGGNPIRTDQRVTLSGMTDEALELLEQALSGKKE